MNDRPAIPQYGPAAFGEREALPIEGFERRLEQLLGGLPNDGPAAIDVKGLDLRTAGQLQAATIAARIFADADGRALLEFLADASVRRPMALGFKTDEIRRVLTAQA